MTFDPFENRACRDIRNQLGQAFVKALEMNNAVFFNAQASAFLCQDHPQYILEYIQKRGVCFNTVFDQIKSLEKSEDLFFAVFIAMWNLDLFFECHEWMEKEWMQSRGEKKRAYQALILCAVVYEQITYNRIEPAKKLAQKTVALLNRYKSQIPPFLDTDLLGMALTHLLSAPRFNLDL